MKHGSQEGFTERVHVNQQARSAELSLTPRTHRATLDGVALALWVGAGLCVRQTCRADRRRRTPHIVADRRHILGALQRNGTTHEPFDFYGPVLEFLTTFQS